MGSPTETALLSQVIELAVQNAKVGGGPFGALVVRDGEVIARGSNEVTQSLNPTAHAEVVNVDREAGSQRPATTIRWPPAIPRSAGTRAGVSLTLRCPVATGPESVRRWMTPDRP